MIAVEGTISNALRLYFHDDDTQQRRACYFRPVLNARFVPTQVKFDELTSDRDRSHTHTHTSLSRFLFYLKKELLVTKAEWELDVVRFPTRLNHI